MISGSNFIGFNKQESLKFVASHTDLGDYFVNKNNVAIIHYKEKDNLLFNNENNVIFVDNQIAHDAGYRRPIIDEFGHLFYINGNYFTGTCNEFQWNTITNLQFARNVKQAQGEYHSQFSNFTCSCKCRTTDKMF